MSFWLLHVGSVLGLGLVITVACYLLHIPVYYAYIFTAAMVVAQAIDIDHYSGDTSQLFLGAKSVSQEEYDRIYDVDPQRPFHNILLYKVGTCVLLGLWMGWTIHLLEDGLL